MKIIEKLSAKSKNVRAANPVTIAFLGDSVTHGCFECYKTGERSLETVFERNQAYSTRLAEMLALLYPNAQVNVINSGISGDCAVKGVDRVQRDVLAYNPDLVVVSYGLNDSGEGLDGLNAYETALRNIFAPLKEKGMEVIFLTENYMNTAVSPHLQDAYFVDVAQRLAERQNGGILKQYFERAKQVCAEMDIRVCDVYSKWEKMHQGGVNVTELLANKLNHPIRQMHYYIAIKLLETMFEQK